MATTIEYPVTTGPDGSCFVIVNPFNAHLPAAVVDGTYLPFTIVSPTAFPYNNLPANTTNTNGPFFGQSANMVNYAVDTCSLSFIDTEAALSCKGKLTVSMFYQSPNATFYRNTTTGKYTSTNITINDQ